MSHSKSPCPQQSQWLASLPKEKQRSDWLLTRSHTTRTSQTSSATRMSNIHLNEISETKLQDQKQTEKDAKRRRRCGFWWCFQCLPCLCPLLLGLLMGLLIGGIILAIVLPLWLLSNKATTTTLKLNVVTASTAISTSIATTQAGSTISSTTILTTTSTIKTTTATTTTTKTTTATTTTTTKTTTATTTTVTTPTTTVCNTAAPGQILSASPTNKWESFSATFVANQTEYVLAVGFTNSPSADTYFDEISVVSTTPPSVELIKNGDFQNSSITWEYWELSCLAACTGNADGGNLLLSGCYGPSTSHCFKGSCSTGYLFLRQTFSTTIGQTYRISFMASQTGPASTLDISVY